MSVKYNDFDPLIFLGLTASGDQKDLLKERLMTAIIKYLMCRISEELSEKKLANISSPDQFFELADREIPNLDQKIVNFLADFKMEFKGVLTKNG